MYFEGELPVMTYGNNCNSNQNSGWNDWSWIIGLALVGGLFGGWGNGGFGFGGNRGGALPRIDISNQHFKVRLGIDCHALHVNRHRKVFDCDGG